MTAQTDAASALASAVVAMTETIPATGSPKEAIRILIGLAQFQAPIAGPTGPIPLQSSASAAVASLCRRAAIGTLAKVISTFQPASYTDAQALILSVGGVISAEAVVAADAGDTRSYVGLLQLGAMLVGYLTTRGAQLPAAITVSSSQPMPALWWAEKLYGNGSRVDQIIAANPKCPHPAFLGPGGFNALSA